MKNKMKRWAALIAAAAIVVAMLPGTALMAKAVGETGTFILDGIEQTGTLVDSGYVDSSNRIQYKIIERSNGTKHLEFTGSGDMPNFTTYNGSVDEKWKYGGSNITSVAFGKGITRIGDYTLGSPGNVVDARLQSIWLPEGLLEIGVNAFIGFSGGYIRIPSTVTTLSYGSISGYSGTNLTIPASLTYIGYDNMGKEKTRLYYPGTEAEFLSKVKGSDTGSADSAYKAMQEKGTFGATDPQYGNYQEYVPFKVGSGPIPPKPDNPFVDVPAGSYYEDAVNWAVDENIAKGTDDTHFSPNAPCTRAQAVTFLYRAAGEPAVSGTLPFNDVSTSYRSAVLWAYQNNITVGISSTTFGSNDPCSRAQIVTFMWRAAGQPSAGGSVQFTDVSGGNYFFASVRWAVGQNITNGTDTTHFSPNSTCTRAQIVTMLYRGR